MIGKYGKVTLLNDPAQQKIMLSHRSISGYYVWRDYKHKSSYTGSYEKAFLEFLDLDLNFDPEDVMSPSPHTYYYEYEGKKHFYIPDFFIPSLYSFSSFVFLTTKTGYILTILGFNFIKAFAVFISSILVLSGNPTII